MISTTALTRPMVNGTAGLSACLPALKGAPLGRYRGAPLLCRDAGSVVGA